MWKQMFFLQMLRLHVTCRRMFVERCSASDPFHYTLQPGLQPIRRRLENLPLSERTVNKKTRQSKWMKGYSLCVEADKVGVFSPFSRPTEGLSFINHMFQMALPCLWPPGPSAPKKKKKNSKPAVIFNAASNSAIKWPGRVSTLWPFPFHPPTPTPPPLPQLPFRQNHAGCMSKIT